jgi:hypothetical protein
MTSKELAIRAINFLMENDEYLFFQESLDKKLEIREYVPYQGSILPVPEKYRRQRQLDAELREAIKWLESIK